VSLDNTLGLT